MKRGAAIGGLAGLAFGLVFSSIAVLADPCEQICVVSPVTFIAVTGAVFGLGGAAGGALTGAAVGYEETFGFSETP